VTTAALHRVDFSPAPDPFYREVPLPHVVELPVLGVRTSFSTNSVYVRDLIEETFGAWRDLPPGEAYSTERVNVSLVVHDGEETGDPAPLTFRLPDEERMLVHSTGSVGTADVARRAAVAYITPALAAQRNHFRYGFIEALTFVLLTPLDRQPVHAAAVRRDGPALLLAAPSGTGKSTLAFAAHRAGMAVLSEDAVYVQLTPGVRVWGRPGPVFLHPDADRWFGPIGPSSSIARANGREKMATFPSSNHARPLFADGAGVCLLQRGETARLERISPNDAATAMLASLEEGFTRFRATIGPAFLALAQGGAWRLTMPPAPVECVPLLERAFDEMAEEGLRY
jgi:hypothetical protein